MSDLPFDLVRLREAYAKGLSPVEVIEMVFARLAAADDPGIFIHLSDKATLVAAAAGLGAYDPAKPLWGVPFAVKDNIDVFGMSTTAACPDYTYEPKEDATVVALLRAAGAIPVGKTNMDQFATGLVGVRSPYPIPRNAIDPKLVPGGSSSGSAVAVARGIVSFSLGTDTAGSGRVPAGLNNIVGLKPSLGALSTTGVVPACRTLDCVSIFALTIDDAHAVFSVAARPDPADAYSQAFPAAAFGVRPVLRVGVPRLADRQFFGDSVMEAAYEAALEKLKTLGCELVELPFGDFYAVANLLYEGAWVAERYAAIKDFFDAHEEALHPVTRRIYGGAKALSAADAFTGFYALQAYKRKLAPLIASVNLICVPTAPTHYTLADLAREPIRENSRLGTYTNFVNLLDMCGIAVPSGTRSDGLPASVTLLAPAGADALAATLARELCETTGLPLGATGWSQPAPSAASPRPPDDGITLVVVGAHLSGMPLNPQLLAAGARFDRAVTTTADYRLYALPGQSPAKPGLIRSADGDGVTIEAEVWRFPPVAFAAFVSTIQPPLGIGTITLADGTSAKGFLAESAGLHGATDISDFGSWRAFTRHCRAMENGTAAAAV